MKQKTRLFLTIVSLCFVVILGVVGIFAVKTLNMSVGGNISFSAEGLSFAVSKGEFKTTSKSEYTGIMTENNKLQAFTMNTDTKESAILSAKNSWSNLNLTLSSLGDAVLVFTVTNNMQNEDLAVVINVKSMGTNTNDNMSISVESAEVKYGTPKQFEIVFDILDHSINAGLTGFEIDIKFAKASESLPSNLQVQYKTDQNGALTSEIDYYFIELGTYNNAPVRWRYVSSDGITNQIQKPEAGGQGWFVQETPIGITKQFSERGSSATFDYANNQIGLYMKDFYDVLNISSNSKYQAIYDKIQPRTMQDLYKGACWDNDMETYKFKDVSTSVERADHFWIMSLKEIYALVGGGDVSDGAVYPSANWTSAVKNKLVWEGCSGNYWLRNYEKLGAVGRLSITQTGELNIIERYDVAAVRAAFIMNF